MRALARQLPRRNLGCTGLEVSLLSLGGVGIGGGSQSELYGGVTDDEAIECVHRAIERGINFIDTSPLYAHSERRIGLALASLEEEKRKGLLVGSKVGDNCPPYSDNGGHSPFSYDGVMCSVEHTLKQLKVLNHLDTVLVHDPSMSELQDEFMAPELGGLAALEDLKRQGVVKHIGIGCVEHEQQTCMMDHPSCEIVLTVNDYNILRRYASEEQFELANSKGIGIMNAGCFYMGLLANAETGWSHGFLNTLDQPKLVALAQEIQEWCENVEGVPLRTAALSFASRHEYVSTLPVGCRNSAEVDECVDSMLSAETCDDEFWRRFKEMGFEDKVSSLDRSMDHWYYSKDSVDLS